MKANTPTNTVFISVKTQEAVRTNTTVCKVEIKIGFLLFGDQQR